MGAGTTPESINEAYLRAISTRDARFDGKFFIGVKTTGIYCRPICPAKPKLKNIELYPDALAAEKAGYRPCLRCRPEAAPLSPAWMGRSATVNRALKLIEAHFSLAGIGQAEPHAEPQEPNEDEFAERLGISARHLRRLFELELGTTPKRVFDHTRLGFARQLVIETNLPITEIAFASGFSSVRRFNDSFKERFTRAPSELRRQASDSSKNAVSEASAKPIHLTLTLPYRPPFDWNSQLRFFHSHQIGGVELVDHESYQRVFRIGRTGSEVGALKIVHDAETNRLRASIASTDPRSLHAIARRLRQMFDLDSDPIQLTQLFMSCTLMSGLSEKHAGLRLQRGWDPFETAIGTLLGQLVSVEQGKRMVARLVETHGEAVRNPLTGEPAYLFPEPARLASSELKEIPTTGGRKSAIRELSRRVASGELSLDSTQDFEAFRKSLCEIKGIGAWSAEYISLRALGDTDAFPGTDLILKRAVDLHPALDLESFRPWRAYVAIFLWKEFAAALSKKGKSKAPASASGTHSKVPRGKQK